MLLKYFAKALLSNKRLWVLGIVQMGGWLCFIAAVGTGGTVIPANLLVPYAGVWYGYIALASLSTLAVTIAGSILYSNASLAYGFRYTKLSPASYLSNMVVSAAVMGVALSATLLVASYAVFSERFGTSLPPVDPAGAVLIAVLGGTFMLAFGMALALVVVNYAGMQSQGFLNFGPSMLAIVLGLSQALVALPTALIYASPFNAIESLLFEAYGNIAPHANLTDITSTSLQWEYLLVTLVAWTVALIALDSMLLRRLKPRSIEEARPM
jgi:hypothetical protein